MLDLYWLYGPMPMILEADQAINPDPDYKPYRPTAEEAGTFITTELRAAADALPIEQAEYGRITKGAALHYLLKYYMHEKLWQHALETAYEINGLNIYELEKVKSGISELDKMLYGGLPFGMVCVIAGKRGDGKSTLASQIVARVIDQGYAAFTYSGELPNYLYKSWFDFQVAGRHHIVENQTDYGTVNRFITNANRS